MPSDTLVELEGINGEWIDLTNGDQGISLGTDVKGIYDAPVKAYYEEPGNYPGARYLNHRILRRDITFGVWILDDKGSNSWLSRDSLWAKAWAFNKDCKLHITTPESGHRWLNLRKLESIDVETATDPRGNTANKATMTCVSPDPFWYGEDEVYELKTRTDTRFTPKVIGGQLQPFDQLPQETLSVTVSPDDGRGGLNPTDQPIAVKWTLPASTTPYEGHTNTGLIDFLNINWSQAPYSQFVIPDPKWEDDEFGPADLGRRLRTPGLVYGEDCVLDTDRRVEQFSAANGAPVWSRTNGVRWRNVVPPYTESFTYEVTVTGLPKDSLLTLRIPRPWGRPWGLE
jgi:hypothetical protein